MSHVVTLQTQLKDPKILKKVCDQKGITFRGGVDGPIRETLYSGEVEGVASFKLEGWRFPVVVKENGQIAFDDFNGQWGNRAQLDSVCQDYAVALSVEHYEQEGYRLVDQTVEADGTIQLELVN